MYRTRPRTSNGKPTRKNASRTTPVGNPARISVGRGQFFCHVLARVTYYACYACVRPPVCGPQHDSASRYYPNEHESKIFKVDLHETLTTATKTINQASFLYFFTILSSKARSTRHPFYMFFTILSSRHDQPDILFLAFEPREIQPDILFLAFPPRHDQPDILY